MRKPIRKMVERYYNKSGIKIPVEVKFTNIKVPAKLKTQYDPKTKKYTKNIMQIDDKHYKTLAGLDIKNAKRYLQFTIAHELGHLKRVEDDWESVRTKHIRGFANDKEEDYADKYATKLTKISAEKLKTSLDILQQKYNKTAQERNAKEREKREEKYKKREKEIKEKYSKYFKK